MDWDGCTNGVISEWEPMPGVSAASAISVSTSSGLAMAWLEGDDTVVVQAFDSSLQPQWQLPASITPGYPLSTQRFDIVQTTGEDLVIAILSHEPITGKKVVLHQLVDETGVQIGVSTVVASPEGNGQLSHVNVVALSDSGFVVAWREWGAGFGVSFGRKYDAVGEPKGPKFQITPNEFKLTGFVAASLPDDTCAVVGVGPNSRDVWASLAQPLLAFGPLFQLGDTNNPTYLSNLVARDTDFLVAWRVHVNGSIDAVGFGADGLVSTPQFSVPVPKPCGANDKLSPGQPKVASLAGGDVYVAYTLSPQSGCDVTLDGSGTSINGSRFNADGTMDIIHEVINSYGQGEQLLVGLNSFLDETYVILWTGTCQ